MVDTLIKPQLQPSRRLEILRFVTKSAEIQGLLVAKLGPMIWQTEVANCTKIGVTTRLSITIQRRWFLALINVYKEVGRMKIFWRLQRSQWVLNIPQVVYLGEAHYSNENRMSPKLFSSEITNFSHQIFVLWFALCIEYLIIWPIFWIKMAIFGSSFLFWPSTLKILHFQFPI